MKNRKLLKKIASIFALVLCFLMFMSLFMGFFTSAGALAEKHTFDYYETDSSSSSSGSSSSDDGSSSDGSSDDKTDDDKDDDSKDTDDTDDEDKEEKLFECDYELMAQAAYVVNANTGVVVYEKDAHKAFTSASLVKMMTCILTVEHADSLDGETVTAETWVFNELYGLNASNADIRKGETLTLRELLYAMILPSGNEAAMMTADYISGGYMPNFLYMMNARAKALGCTNTYFADVNGLSEDNYTTAHDTYLILQEFMSKPVLAEIAGTANYEMAAHNHSKPYYISSTNRFLFNSDPYAKAYKTVAGAMLGGKTGGLGEWQNFACLAEYNEQAYYSIVLHSPFEADTVRPTLEDFENKKHRPALVEAAELLTWAFTALGERETIDVRQPVHEVKVRYSTERDAVRLLPTEDLRTVLPKNKDNSLISMEFDVPEYLEAPIEAGMLAGTVTLYLAGEKIGSTSLVTEREVKRNDAKYRYDKAMEFFTSKRFKAFITLLIIAVIIYTLTMLYYNGNKKKKRGKGNWKKS